MAALHHEHRNVLVLIFLAGKTTLCAHLVNALRNDKATTTLYYFCGSPVNSHTDCSRILRSLAIQLIRYEPALATHVCTEYVRQGLSASIAQLRKMLQGLLSAVPLPQVLVDGLDECDPSSQAQILSELFTFSNPSTRLSKVLISSRDGGIIGRKLRQKPTLSLREESQSVENDIHTFVKITLQQTCSEWCFDVSESSLAKIESELLRLSNGER
jgi:NACHT domain